MVQAMELTQKWADFLTKLYSTDETKKQSVRMASMHTKHELTPENIEALTKWLKNGSEVMWKGIGIFLPTIQNILQNIHGHVQIKKSVHGRTKCGICCYRRCCEYPEGQTNLEEDPKVIAKRERVEALWKDI
jgi:hypothetical protein